MVYKVTGYINTNTMKVQPISYSSNSLLSAQTNTTDSTIKIKLDSWYKSNLASYTSYLADETFCNDRSIASGDGYKLDSSTYYGAYNRLVNKRTPSLKCSQDNDKFRVSGISAKLDYPVGLIQADEAALAGGAYRIDNTNYYLYNSVYFWTLTPSIFRNDVTRPSVWFVTPSGRFDPGITVKYNFSVRPVINIKLNVTISKGDGTALNPFVVAN